MVKSKSAAANQETKIEDQETKIEDQETKIEDLETKIEDQGEHDLSLVYDVNSLFQMRFRDPVDGTICMVRRAFKPRGKLEFYCPEK